MSTVSTSSDNTVHEVSTVSTSSDNTVHEVSTVSKSSDNTVHEGASASVNQAILSMLHKIDASNQALTRRMDDLERHNTISSTPAASPTSQYHGASHIAGIRQDTVNRPITQASAGTSQAHLRHLSQCYE